ncbi:MAG: FAD-dependent monooxygenase, partial [Betaproteobacteria bacterium]|nr:FAD-dependent monooxygenase [Betaproteobacteria bacterium]
MTSQFFVTIVGAGPVGLTLAFLLARRGIGVRVFEAAPEVIEDLRASTFHPPTLDLLAPFGIADALVKQGRPCPDWQVRMHPEGERAVFDLSAIAGDTAYPFRLQCEQWRLQRLLLAELEKLPEASV